MGETRERRPHSASPRARRKAAELGVALDGIHGSGPGGHIVERDVIRHAEGLGVAQKAREADWQAPAAAVDGRPASAGAPAATPLARRIARMEGVDLAAMSGTGRGGKITSRDVLARLAAPSAVPAAGEREAVPLAGMRKIIAERMLQSWTTIPHVTLMTEAVVTRLVRVREELAGRAEREGGVRPTYTDLIIRACALALREHPDCNVSLENGMLVRHADIHIGVAVALEHGLIVPVVRDADRKTTAEIAALTKELVRKARSGRLQPDAVSGGRFSVSNLGMYEVDAFTPIVNPPEPAILGVGRIREGIVVRDGAIRIEQTMALSLSFDHRLMDGAPAARLLQAIKRHLEYPDFALAERG